MNNVPECMYDYRYEAQKAIVVDVCDVCGNGIYNGDEYYQFGTDTVCEDCVNDYIREFKKVGELK